MTVRPIQIVASASAAERLDAAVAFLRQFPAHQPITIVAATRGAADDVARRMAIERGATIGLARYSLTQLAARVALMRLGGRGIAPATALGSEAIAARAAFDAGRDGTLSYLARVADTPGFPRALARTLGELRTAGIGADAVAAAGHAGPDLARLLIRAEEELAEAATADRAALFAAATELTPGDASLRHPLLLLDVAIASAAEQRFVQALVAECSSALATVPAHDQAAR